MTVTQEQLDLLRSKGQRYRMFLAVWDSWEFTARIPKLVRDTETTEPKVNLLGTFNYEDFDPIINMGPNRLGFVGEPLTFDGSRSFKVDDDTDTPNNLAWEFPDSNTPTASGAGPHSVTWNTAGLYRVTCSKNDTESHRMVRILENRQQTDWDVVEVGGITGSVQSGWNCSVTVQPNDDGKAGIEQLDVENFQHVGLFVEEEWETSEYVFERIPQGHYPQEPRLVISGVIMQGSATIDANTHKVNFTIGSISDQVNIGYVRQTQSASKKFIKEADIESKFGAIFNVDKMRMPEIMLFWLQRYTNLLKRHDFYTWWPNNLQDLETVSSSDSISLWSALQAWAQSEYFWLFVDQGNAVHYEPNPHIRSINSWKDRYPLKMVFTDEDILDLQVRKDLSKNVSYVQIKATKPSKEKAFMGYYPNRNPGNGPGTWQFVDGLLAQQQSYIDNLAERIYKDANRKIEITMTTGINRLISVPDRIALTIAIPELDIDWTEKVFYVEAITYQPNLDQGTWSTQITASEEIM